MGLSVRLGRAWLSTATLGWAGVFIGTLGGFFLVSMLGWALPHLGWRGLDGAHSGVSSSSQLCCAWLSSAKLGWAGFSLDTLLVVFFLVWLVGGGDVVV